MFNWINYFFNRIACIVAPTFNKWLQKLDDYIDVWYTSLLWEIEDNLVDYINSRAFAFVSFLYLIIPFSELVYYNSVYFLLVAIMALIFDIIFYYFFVYILDFDKAKGLAPLAVRITSMAFYLCALFNEEVFQSIACFVFHGSGDYIISESLFIEGLALDLDLLQDKKEILVRICIGLGIFVIFSVFFKGAKKEWEYERSLNLLYNKNPNHFFSVDSSFKSSLGHGVNAVCKSVVAYPIFWVLPTFLFFSIADLSSLYASPVLVYIFLALFDTIRFLSYDFAYFETIFWWFFFCGLLVYFGNFSNFKVFLNTIRAWIRDPLSNNNLGKLIFVGFFLVVCPFFWFITDNASINAFIAILALENSWVIIYGAAFFTSIYFFNSIVLFFRLDSEEDFVVSIFITTCFISLFFLGLTLDFNNTILDGKYDSIFTLFNLLDFIGFDGHELFVFGYDYIALLLCLMTCVVFSIVMYFSIFSQVKYKPSYFFWLFYLLFFILISFLSLNLLTFYMAFESTIIPIGFLIIQWGSSDKRYFAGRQYVFYSIVSGLPLLAGLGYLYGLFGTLDYLFVLNNLFTLSYNEQLYLWFAFFLVFAVKVPLFPFHSWLLNAHVEASTGVSIILAAVLLKIGIFGIIRYLLGIFHLISAEYAVIISFFALAGVVYSSISAITEVDLKRLIAYTSVAHMNMSVIGLFMFDESAFYGAVISMFAHSVVSTALFFIIGVLYSRVHIREIFVYGGMVQLMPILSSFLFFFAIANAGFPCSFSFIGEVFLFTAFFKKFGLLFIILIIISSVLLLFANLRLFMYVCFGTINDNYISEAISDFGHLEICVWLVLFLNAFLPFLNFDHFFFPLFCDCLARYFFI